MTDVKRLTEAMFRRDHNAIYDALVEGRAVPLRGERCIGCSHLEHDAMHCTSVPLFTSETKCGCWFGPIRMAS